MTRRFVFRPPPSRFAERVKRAAEADDLAAAVAFWRKHVPEELKGLIEAANG